MANITVQQKNEDWDPEYTPKSRKYYLVGSISFPIKPPISVPTNHTVLFRLIQLKFVLLQLSSWHTSIFSSQHDDREHEAERKWADNRGRGRGGLSRGRARFIIRKATGGPNTNGPKWAHDKFQINGERGDAREEETEQDHKEGEINEENTWAVKS